MAKLKKTKVICPTCKGNGYVRIPYRLAEEEVTAQCGGQLHISGRSRLDCVAPARDLELTCQYRRVGSYPLKQIHTRQT